MPGQVASRLLGAQEYHVSLLQLPKGRKDNLQRAVYMMMTACTKPLCFSHESTARLLLLKLNPGRWRSFQDHAYHQNIKIDIHVWWHHIVTNIYAYSWPGGQHAWFRGIIRTRTCGSNIFIYLFYIFKYSITIWF